MGDLFNIQLSLFEKQLTSYQTFLLNKKYFFFFVN